MARARYVWYLLWGINWGIVVFFWISGSGIGFDRGAAGVLMALGRIAGLSAAYMILVQFFLASRIPFLEKTFGLDHLLHFHKTHGKVAFSILLLHPVSLVMGASMLSDRNMVAQFLVYLQSYKYVIWAFVGLILFTIIVSLSLYFVRKHLRYEAWYLVHLLTYVAVFSSFWHQIEVGTDLILNNLFYGYWIALYVGVFFMHILFRFVRPLRMFYKHKFRIDRVERESPTAVSVYITGRNMESFDFDGGQFMMIRFFTKGTWWQAHPFSFSQAKNGKEIRITVRELGDFTRHIKDLPLGTKVLIEGPYGIFTDLFGVSSKTLLVAGGIGITPLRSLMEEQVRKGKDVILLYGNKTMSDIPLKDEIELLAQSPTASVTHVMSSDPTYDGELGHIDEEKIRRLVPDISERDIYICGPLPMVESLKETFARLGVSYSRIHSERFAL